MVATILAVWRAKEFQDVLGVFVWLCSINTAFWLLARAAGALVHLMGEIMWEWLWGLLATVYNVALAVLFAAIVFISANRVTQIGSPLGRQMCGFVLLYLALSAAYMDSEASEINEYARP
ncbi:MAG: hypothetical protein HYZ74_05335, partial [Elusimicrobia bacterium]|nr:hypothetical protein [Elusimicrobiota bacterium]